MSLSQSFLAELDQEMPTTRRLIERVPSEKGEWKPHPKSFSLGHLTQLVSNMPGWITQCMKETELDLAGFKGYTYENTDTLLGVFDQNVKECSAALSAATDSDFMVGWSLRQGDRVFFTLPRVAVTRQTINHLVHHRGQLSVYLRLIDVPLPSIYGPTADERW